MTQKRITFPRCGTCDLAVPSEEPGTLWCHGGPPTAHPSVNVVMVDNKPVDRSSMDGYYPPVGVDKPGCALHPQVRRKIGLAA